MARVMLLHPPLWVPPGFVDSPVFGVIGALDLMTQLEAAGHETLFIDALVQGEASARSGQELRIGCTVPELLALTAGSLARAPVDWIAIQRSPYHRTRRNMESVLDPLIRGLAEGSGANEGDRASPRLAFFDGHLGDIHYIQDDPGRLFARYPTLDAVAIRESSQAMVALVEGRADPGLYQRSEETSPSASEPDPGGQAARPGPGGPSTGRRPIEGLDVAAYTARYRHFGAEDLIQEYHDQGEAIFPISTSRGCPFSCSFCTREEGRSWEPRSLDEVEGDARLLRDQGVDCLVVVDPIANLDPERFDDLLARVEALGLRLRFPNGLRVDRLYEESIPRLARLTDELCFSVESTAPRVMKELIGKRLDLTRVEPILIASQRAELPVSIHYIIGAPGEGADEVNHTLGNAAEWLDRFSARPLVQAYVPRERFAVPEGQDHLPDDFYAAFGDDSAARGLPARARQEVPGALPAAELDARLSVFRRKLAEGGEEKLIVNLTYACNNNCQFCSVGDRERRHGDFDLQFGEIRAARARGIRLLDLDGGEPTLYPRLFELLDAVRTLGFERTTITSNGRRLAYRAFAERLASYDVQLLISFHGSRAEVHEGLTQAPGSWKQSLKGLRQAREVFKEFGVNTTVTSGNIEDLPDLARLLRRLGQKRWTIQILTPFGNAEASQVVSPEALRAVLPGLLDRFGESLGISVIGLPYCELPGYERYVMDDHFKMARDMLFVDGERVNLGRYLAERRYHIPERCDPCPYRVLCNGFWQFDAPLDPKSPGVPANELEK